MFKLQQEDAHAYSRKRWHKTTGTRRTSYLHAKMGMFNLEMNITHMRIRKIEGMESHEQDTYLMWKARV